MKKRKRKFTLFSRRKGSKSKKGAKEFESLKENNKTEDEGNKTHGGGKKPKPKKEKEKKEKS